MKVTWCEIEDYEYETKPSIRIITACAVKTFLGQAMNKSASEIKTCVSDKIFYYFTTIK